MSKTLSISKILQQIDVVKREYFARVEITSKRTHSYSSYKKKTSRAGEIEIPHYLDRLSIPIEAKRKLALIPEYIFYETKYQCEKKSKSGWKPDDPVKYFVGTAMRMAENKGHIINWRKYMQTKCAA